MNRQLLSWSFIILVVVLIFGVGYRTVSASTNSQGRNSISLAGDPQAAPTLIPTTTPVALAGPTSEPRVLPPVGTNAGLVIGASLLVLIIIGGVLSARLRAKH